MMSRMAVGVLGACALLALAGCAIHKGISDRLASVKRSPDVGAIRVGATRGEVEIQLGPPAVSSVTLPDGGRVDIYEYEEYEVGNEPSAGRAVFDGVMDNLTLGLWLVIRPLGEGVAGEKRQIQVTYGPDDRVVETQLAPATQP